MRVLPTLPDLRIGKRLRLRQFCGALVLLLAASACGGSTVVDDALDVTSIVDTTESADVSVAPSIPSTEVTTQSGVTLVGGADDGTGDLATSPVVVEPDVAVTAGSDIDDTELVIVEPRPFPLPDELQDPEPGTPTKLVPVDS